MASSDSTAPSLLDEYRQSQGDSPLLAEYRKAQEPSALQRFLPSQDDVKNVLSNEYEAARGAVTSIFGGLVGAPAQALATVLAPQTPAEQANPIAQGYAAAKVGLPPSTTTGGSLADLGHALDFNLARMTGGPAQKAVALAKGLVPDPVGHIRQAIQAPDWFTRGEALGAVPLDLGMVYAATHGLASAADAVRSSPTGPAEVVAAPNGTAPKATAAPETQAYGGQNTIQPLGLLDQYRQATAQPEAAPIAPATPPTAPAPSPVVGNIAPAQPGAPTPETPREIAPPLPKDLTKVSDQDLLNGYHDRLDRLQGMDVNMFTRFDPNAVGPMGEASGTVRFGVGSALVNKARSYLGRIETELKNRGFDDDQLDRLYRDHTDQQAAASGAASNAAGGFNDELGWSLPLPRGKAPKPGEASLFGEPQTNLLGETTAPTMGESTVGQRIEGTPEGLSASLLRAQALLDDPKEQFLASTGQPTPEYIQARALIGKPRTTPPPPTPTPGQGGLFESLPINVSRAAGEGARAIPEEPKAGPPSPLKLAAPRAGIAGAIQTMFAPATRTPEAATAAGIVRYRAAEFARATEVAHEALGQYRGIVSKLSPTEQLGLIDDLENGRSPKRPDLQPVAKGIRGALDAARDDVRGLGTGALEKFNRDYFPHLWQDPEKAGGVLSDLLSRRPLEGPKSFLKKRTIPSIAEGIEAGLVPVTTNPLDLTLLKLREERRYIMGQRIMADLRDNRLTQYVPAFSEGPKGWKPIDDRIAKVYGPPTVSVSESFDPAVRDQLEAVLHSVGGQHTRTVRMPGGSALGSATGGDVRTRFGTDVTVLEHEIGHALDAKYQLWDHLTSIPGKDQATVNLRVETQKELRALADLRFEGQEATPGYRRYVRQAPEKIANAVHALIYAPERMEEVAPTIKARLTAFMEGKPELRPLLNIRKSLVAASEYADVPVGGLVVKGQHWAPEPVARVLNNYLQPGLRGNALYDSYMGLGNILNQAQLGLSAFHLGFTSLDAAVSKSALGLEQVVAGHPFTATETLAGVPTAPFTTYLRGSKVLKEYLNPGRAGSELGAIVDGLVQAGGRVRMDAIYRNNSVEAFQKALQNRQRGKAAILTLPALLELASKPVLEHVVPRQKLGVFADLAQFEMSRMPKDASPAEVRAVLGKVWDSVDNRLGQLVYDNLFWSRTLKDLSLASVRSVGWNLGTMRELGGGAADIVRGRFTHRAAYAIGLPMTVGLAGAVTQYLYTGQGPHELKDYFFPRTGRVNPDGNEERVQLPSYVKDLVSYSNHPWQTVKNKIQPFLGMLTDMLSNKDFYQNEIRNPHDPFMVQLQQEAKYLAGQFIPFGVRNALQQRREGQSLATQAQSFVGITPAPRELVRTPAQNLISEYQAERGHGSGTPEEQADRQRRADITRGVRSGQITPKQLGDSMRAGALSREQAGGILRRENEPAWTNQFRSLTWEEGEQVYAKATPEEQAALRPLLTRKRVEEYMRLTKAGVHDGRVEQLRQSLRATAGK
jgi:hypothetical protein